MSERRKNFRVEWTSPASIEPGDGRPRLSCTVLNLSNGGARVVCAEDLPDQFILRLTPGRGRPRACSVVWRRGREVGVQFTDMVPAHDVPARRSAIEPVL
jgi:hypothetical protein